MDIIETFKKNPLVYKIGCWGNIFIHNYIFDIKSLLKVKLRKMGILNEEKFQSIKSLKDRYKGNRCFLIATGPSLTYNDLNLLKEEYTIGVNSLVKILDKIPYLPTFFGIQDGLVYDKIGNLIENSKLSQIFISDECYKKVKKNDKRFIQYPIYYKHHDQHGEMVNLSSGFTDDASQVVYDGYSVTYSMLQIAVYMGFNEIYLLGCDCSYDTKGGKHHFVESGHFDKQAATVGERMIYAYTVADKWLKENRPDVKVYNATRGGMLEVFERRTLDDVFKEL